MKNRDSALSARFDEQEIDSIFADVNQGLLPGVAVGIAIDGLPVYRKGFGLASIELPVTLSPSTRMRIGSISKHFTAFAYMMFCESGIADIDDPVGKYLPQLHPIAHKVTIRQLMGNTSGLREATDIVVQFSGVEGRPVSADQVLSLYRDMDDVNAAAGTAYNYNNGGFLILSAIIEKISGLSLERALWEHVFKPAGMYDTLLRRSDQAYLSNSASTHVASGTGTYLRMEPIGGIDFAGAGAVVSTIDNLLRWMANMDRPIVGNSNTWEVMRAPQKLKNGTSTGYGLGLETVYRRGVMRVEHGGGGFGGNSMMVKVPQARLDVIVITNRSDRSAFLYTEKILDACLPNLEPIPARYEGPFTSGLFRSPTTGRVVQLLRGTWPNLPGEGLQLAAIDGHYFPFAPDEYGVLRTVTPADSHNCAISVTGEWAAPSSIQLNEFGNVDWMERVVPTGIGDTDDIIGRFRSETTGTDLTITNSIDGNHFMRAEGRFGSACHQIECLSRGIWRTWALDKMVAPPWGLLLFTDDCRELGFYNATNSNIRFRRVL